jgi:hypothetical protein
LYSVVIVIGFLFFVSIVFKWLFRSSERSGLGLFNLIKRVLKNFWGLSRIEASISTLQTVSNIETHEFVSFSNG